MLFTVSDVTDAVAAAIPDRTLVIQGDRRFTYAEVVARANRLAAYLHAQGLGVHTERDQLAGHEVGQDLVGIYAYNGPEFVESLLGAFRARVAPFNVNYRYVKAELQYLLNDAGASALIAVIDYVFTRQSFMKRMRMSRREIKEEHRQQDGDPMVKAKLRQIRIQRSRQRMMQNVPQASVMPTPRSHTRSSRSSGELEATTWTLMPPAKLRSRIGPCTVRSTASGSATRWLWSAAIHR